LPNDKLGISFFVWHSFYHRFSENEDPDWFAFSFVAPLAVQRTLFYENKNRIAWLDISIRAKAKFNLCFGKQIDKVYLNQHLFTKILL